GEMVRRAPGEESHRPRPRQAVVQRRLRAASRRGPVRRHRPQPLLPDRGGAGGPQRVRREASGELRKVPEVGADPADAAPMQTTLTAERIRGSVDKGLWRNESLESYLDRWAVERPDKTAIVDARGRYTYADIWRKVERIAHGLRAHGVEAGTAIS